MEKLKEFADKLNGVGYYAISDEMCELAKDLGIVIVFGASDDLMEFRGAIYEEFDCFEGRVLYFNEEGCELDLREYDNPDIIALMSNKIEAVWCDKDSEWTWSYKTAIPHETFGMIDGGEKYCLGLVFYKKDLI